MFPISINTPNNHCNPSRSPAAWAFYSHWGSLTRARHNTVMSYSDQPENKRKNQPKNVLVDVDETVHRYATTTTTTTTAMPSNKPSTKWTPICILLFIVKKQPLGTQQNRAVRGANVLSLRLDPNCCSNTLGHPPSHWHRVCPWIVHRGSTSHRAKLTPLTRCPVSGERVTRLSVRGTCECSSLPIAAKHRNPFTF